MPQSLGRVYLHLIFSTKGRAPLLDDAIRPSLHSYMAVVLRNVDCPVELINSVSDHVHILFELGRTLTYSQAVEEVKRPHQSGSRRRIRSIDRSLGRQATARFPFPLRASAKCASTSRTSRCITASDHFKTSSAASSNGIVLHTTNGTFGIEAPFQGFANR